jgi:hypothetical protein
MAETGHARNVERFAQMISFVQAYGADYAPGNAALQLASLQAKRAAAQAGIDGVAATLAPWKTAVNNRQDAFDGIRKLTTRVVNSFESSGATKNAVDDARAFKRKIDGEREKALPKDDPLTPKDESKGISVSQQSYTQLVEHFDNLITLLEGSGTYAPNETELQLATLKTYSTTLKNANTAVINATPPLSNSRIARDESLYADDTGLVDLAGLVKKYVKSLYGADSPQFEQLDGLKFSRPKD